MAGDVLQEEGGLDLRDLKIGILHCLPKCYEIFIAKRIHCGINGYMQSISTKDLFGIGNQRRETHHC